VTAAYLCEPRNDGVPSRHPARANGSRTIGPYIPRLKFLHGFSLHLLEKFPGEMDEESVVWGNRILRKIMREIKVRNWNKENRYRCFGVGGGEPVSALEGARGDSQILAG
jgi:hypothetical protein